LNIAPFAGMTLRNLLNTIDPRVRFPLPDGALATAGALSGMTEIPQDYGGSIYTAIEDEEGFIYIVIAPSVGVDDRNEWFAEQMQRPLFKSIDRVDLLGNVMGGAD